MIYNSRNTGKQPIITTLSSYQPKFEIRTTKMANGNEREILLSKKSYALLI